MAAKQKAEATGGSNENKIRERAYQLWEEAGRPEGQHGDHWGQAMREIEAEAGGSAKPAAAKDPARETPKPAAKAAPAGEDAAGPKADSKKRVVKAV